MGVPELSCRHLQCEGRLIAANRRFSTSRDGQSSAPILKDTYQWCSDPTDLGRGVELATWEASVETSILSSLYANKIVERSRLKRFRFGHFFR